MAKYIVVHSVKVATEFVPQTFGRLTTIGPVFLLTRGNQLTRKSRDRCQVCSCTCGEISVILVGNLKNKTKGTRSCGCLCREANTKHGQSNSPLCKVWRAMLRRCSDANQKTYVDYGGRGIRVCDRWRDPENGFLNFLSDMGERPSQKHTIERENVDGDYCPENCRWATPGEQARNKRNNLLLTFNDKTQCLAAWAEFTGIDRMTLKSRLLRGWSHEATLTTPVRRGGTVNR